MLETGSNTTWSYKQRSNRQKLKIVFFNGEAELLTTDDASSILYTGAKNFE